MIFRMNPAAHRELWFMEHDTDDSGLDDAHHHLAEQLEASARPTNHSYYEVPLTPETLVYLAENIHYHIDRAKDWEFQGAPIKRALEALERNVKTECDRLKLDYLVWNEEAGGMVPRKVQQLTAPLSAAGGAAPLMHGSTDTHNAGIPYRNHRGEGIRFGRVERSPGCE